MATTSAPRFTSTAVAASRSRCCGPERRLLEDRLVESWSGRRDDARHPKPCPTPRLFGSTRIRRSLKPREASSRAGSFGKITTRRSVTCRRKAYECYNLERRAGTGGRDVARGWRPEASAQVSRPPGKLLGTSRNLEATLSAAEPFIRRLRVMDHPVRARVQPHECPERARRCGGVCGSRGRQHDSGSMPLEYGDGFGMTVRFKTRGGDPPVLRLLWRKENNTWRVTSYSIEMP